MQTRYVHFPQSPCLIWEYLCLNRGSPLFRLSFSEFGLAPFGFDEFNKITLNSPPSTHTSLMRIDPLSHVQTASWSSSNVHAGKQGVASSIPGGGRHYHF